MIKPLDQIHNLQRSSLIFKYGQIHFLKTVTIEQIMIEYFCIGCMQIFPYFDILTFYKSSLLSVSKFIYAIQLSSNILQCMNCIMNFFAMRSSWNCINIQCVQQLRWLLPKQVKIKNSFWLFAIHCCAYIITSYQQRTLSSCLRFSLGTKRLKIK